MITLKFVQVFSNEEKMSTFPIKNLRVSFLGKTDDVTMKIF